MLETEEVDEDYFTPVSSTSLADVFSKNPNDDSINGSLKYIPPKPQTSKEDLNAEKTTECVLACALFGYQWANNEYKAKGKLGFAILKILKSGDYSIVLYDTNKVTLSQVALSPNFELNIKGNCNISYYDKAQRFWSLYGTEDEVRKIGETLLKLNGRIRHSLTTDKNPPENLNKVESTNSKRKKNTSDIGSDTDSSVNRRAKMSILNRMANMGQSVLPAQNVPIQKISDSSDSNDEKKYAPAKHKNSKSATKQSNPPKTMSNDIIAPIDTFTTSQLLPLPPTTLFPPLSTGSTDFTLFLSEQRVCNSELRINFNRLSDKVDQILDKVKFLNLSNDSSVQTSVHSDITQKLLNEYENKIKCYEEIIRGMDTQYVKEKMLLNITSKNVPFNQLVDERAGKSSEDSNITKLCSEIESLKEKIDQLIVQNPKSEEKIIEELSNLKKILESKTDEITNVCSSTSTQGNVENKIKTLMNETFQTLCVSFEDSKQYTGEEIKSLLAATIKKATVESLKEAKA